MKITFLGDIMFDSMMSSTVLKNYYNTVKEEYDFFPMFEKLKDFLDKSDYVIANLETPISYDNSNLTNHKWEFCTPKEFAFALKKVGVDYVSTANNHCLDRGMEGVISTIKVLDEAELAHSGTYESNEKRNIFMFDKSEIRIGVMSYTYGTNAKSNRQYLGRNNRRCVDLIQEQEEYVDEIVPWVKHVRTYPNGLVSKIRNMFLNLLFPDNKGKEWYEKETFNFYRKILINKDIAYLKKRADLSVMCLHIGGQYNVEPSSYTKKITNWLIKKKVDLVICNHEHVVHSHKYYENKNGKKQFVAYALGNCLSSAGLLHSPYDRRSDFSVAVHFYLDEKKKDIKNIKFSILKSVMESENSIAVYPVYDLLKTVCNEEERINLEKDALIVASDFSNRCYDFVDEEFDLYE